ncbi:MAG TPA: hypothetical protein VL614_06410 [Acetobacteraceae bacterium]|jgi:hypothetical protein|nr:hypothetical protein [Acetobacteraceae bacterium]
MKYLLRTALLAASIGSIGTAYADGGEGPAPNTYFTELPGVIAQAPTQDNHAYAGNKSGPANATQQGSGVVFPWSSRG